MHQGEHVLVALLEDNKHTGCSSREAWFGDDAGFRMLDESGFRVQQQGDVVW